MSKAFLTFGILGVAGALSICDFSKPIAMRAPSSFVAVAHAAPIADWEPRASMPALEPRTVTLRIEGMTCGGCVFGVRKVLTKLDGVSSAEVSYANQSAVVTYDSSKVTVEQMVTAIRTLGYKATVVTA